MCVCVCVLERHLFVIFKRGRGGAGWEGGVLGVEFLFGNKATRPVLFVLYVDFCGADLS